mmetsp:Transcript_137033/g.382079  ORF Transcript_137033/g.382079 Transcript_137033/m.382079 type:complete len:677 (-) Transcript_137033:372-2402(-)
MRLVSNQSKPTWACDTVQLCWLLVLVAPRLARCIPRKEASCESGCSGHGVCAPDGQCICGTQWAGRDCSYFLEDVTDGLEVRTGVDGPPLQVLTQAAPDSCMDGCSGHGSCQNGACACNDGWGGSTCSTQRACQGICRNGRCLAGRCVCSAGFIGPACEDRLCPNNCWGHGACDRGVCICVAGWEGPQCESLVPARYPQAPIASPAALPSTYALDRARRAAKAARNAADQLLLLAKRENERDAGERIERAVQAARQHVGALRGKHAPIASGEMDAKCGQNCTGNGQCNITAGGCQCFEGWRGKYCDSKQCPDDCSGRGVCIAGRCLCNAAFFGVSCQNKRCPGDCSGHGYCFAGRCQCTGDFGGETCTELVHSSHVVLFQSLTENSGPKKRPSLEMSDYCLNGCSGHGDCVHGVCMCHAGYHGPNCSTQGCCSAHGTCKSGSCVCDEGWTGRDCGMQLLCPAPTCSGHGTCVHGGRCKCETGYGGPACDLPIITLEASCPEGCSGHGSCINGICSCSPDWGGSACDLAQARELDNQSAAALNQLASGGTPGHAASRASSAGLAPMTAAWIPPAQPSAVANAGASHAPMARLADQKVSLLGVADHLLKPSDQRGTAKPSRGTLRSLISAASLAGARSQELHQTPSALPALRPLASDDSMEPQQSVLSRLLATAAQWR